MVFVGLSPNVMSLLRGYGLLNTDIFQEETFLFHVTLAFIRISYEALSIFIPIPFCKT